jgi:hypothetical protein
MRREVAKTGNQLDDETLANAYKTLLIHGDRYDNGAIRVLAPKVAPIIANQCNVEGGVEAVKGRIYPQLRKAGFIKPRSGFIWVKPEVADPNTWGNNG